MTIDYGNSFIFQNMTWPAFKATAAAKELRIQYAYDEDAVAIFAVDGVLVHRCKLLLGAVPEGEDQALNDAHLADFEASVKPTANSRITDRSIDGTLAVTPSAFAYVEQKTRFNGFRYVAPADAISIFDEEITTQVYVQGGKATIDNAVDGDMVEFSIVDIDDVLGLFATYGLTPGVDVLELDKYVRSVYPRSPMDAMEHRVEAAALVTSGLYFRITYHAVVGGPDRIIKPVYLWYEE